MDIAAVWPIGLSQETKSIAQPRSTFILFSIFVELRVTCPEHGARISPLDYKSTSIKLLCMFNSAG